jgi:hypothetical protein
MNRPLAVRRIHRFSGVENILLDWLERIDYSPVKGISFTKRASDVSRIQEVVR